MKNTTSKIAGVSKSFMMLFTIVVTSVLLSSCKKEGCTDTVSYNYDSDAKDDDGSCKYYYGGKNFGQLDVGSEIDLNNQFDIYFNGNYIGLLKYYFPSGLSCANPQAIGSILNSGSYVVRAVGSGGSVVRQGTVYLDPQECKVVLIENLPLVTGGGSAGYNCASGGCTYVGSGANYATLSDCQNSCGGSAGYDCVSGSCTYVSSGADYATLSDCQNSCGGLSGDLTFWVNQDMGCGNIYVSVTSYGTATISSFFSSMPGCGVSACANFSGLGYGAYNYSVTSDSGCTWSGNVVVENSCKTVQLSL